MKFKHHSKARRGTDYVFYPEVSDRKAHEKEMKGYLSDAMRKAGTPEELIYAFTKTGMMVTKDNIDQWSKQDLAEYKAAIAEGLKLHGRKADRENL